MSIHVKQIPYYKKMENIFQAKIHTVIQTLTFLALSLTISHFYVTVCILENVLFLYVNKQQKVRWPTSATHKYMLQYTNIFQTHKYIAKHTNILQNTQIYLQNTQIYFKAHKYISKNTKIFRKTQIYFEKHKDISEHKRIFETQIYFETQK